MIGIRARHSALLAFLLSAGALSACAGAGDPPANSSGSGGFGSSHSALNPVVVADCGDSGNLNYGACARETVPTETVWPALFQVIGKNTDEGTGVQQVNELAFKFRTVRDGRPGSMTLYLRRTSSVTAAANHDLLIDLMTLNDDNSMPIPLLKEESDGSCSYGLLENQIARARFNLSLLPFSATTPVDQKVTVNFGSIEEIRLNPNKTYGAYIHVELPGRDRLGVAGMEADVYGSSLGLQPYTRQARVIGNGCITNPQWSPVARRDVFFMLSLNDGCTTGAVAPPCGQGICYTNKSPACDEYGNFTNCFAGYCDKENDSRCVPATGLTGTPESANDYGCDVVNKTCYRRMQVHKTCNDHPDCVPQGAVNVGDYTCDLTTHTCNAPKNNARECISASDPICVPNGGDASKYGCDVATHRCYTLFGAIKESCNGLDDDCDGLADESLPSVTCGLGACERQEYSCAPDGHPFTCPDPDPKVNKDDESCNNVDDDCDGVIDNKPDQSCGLGECHLDGVPACDASHHDISCDALAAALETAEFCDGKDQDCDGLTDNAVKGNPAKLTRPYYPYDVNTLNKGTCKPGTQTCNGSNGIAAWLVTTDPVGPQAVDVCNNLDEDCDGFVDNKTPGQPDRITKPFYTGPAGTSGKGICHDGEKTCAAINNNPADESNWVQSSPEALPATEVCDTIDNDCNGLVDDGLGTQLCGQGVCQIAINNCINGLPAVCGNGSADPQTWGDQTKRLQSGESASYCNGLDDDCDGYVDNFPDTHQNGNLSRDCFTGPSSAYVVTGGVRTYKGICHGGTEVCASGYWPTDGKSGVAAPNPALCVNQVLPGTESCNGLDDDCDGSVDEDSNMCPNTTTNATSMTCGTFNSTKMCVVNSCAAHWFDVDGDPSNGCEVRDDANALASPSNTDEFACRTGVNMGTLAVASAGSSTSLTTQTGVIPKSTYFDYFAFTIAPPSNLTEAGQKISVKVRDTVGGGTDNFKLYVYTSSCGGDLNYCSGTYSNLDTWEFWDANCTGAGAGGSGACSTRGKTFPTTVQIKVARPTKDPEGNPTLSAIGYTLTVTRQAPAP